MEKKGFIFDNEISFLKSICNDDAMKIMQMQQTYYGQGEQEIEYVLRGAKLKCTHGNRYVHLDALEDYGIYSNGHAVMTCRECKPIENIADFRVCGNRYFKPEYSEEAPAPTETEIDENGEEGPKCSPTLMTGWIFINPINILVEHMKDKWEVLLKNSKAICVNGGVISIEENPESDAVEKEVLEWIPENIMQLDGSSEQEKYLFSRITDINARAEDEDYRWNQEKIDMVWAKCLEFYEDYGVQVDPRLLLSIIIMEGSGSFDTSTVNKGADGENGPEIDFDKDLAKAVDLLGGKIIAYAHYKDDFSKAREQAYGLFGIPDYDDILHYLNWTTPRISTISNTFLSGNYAGANEWNRGIREIYSYLAFDKVSEKYTNYALGLKSDIQNENKSNKKNEHNKDLLDIIAKQLGIKILPVHFEAVENGEDKNGDPNHQYTIIGVIDEKN